MKEFDPRTLQQQIISAPTRQQSSHFLAGALGTWCSSRVWNPGSTSHEKPPHSTDFMSYSWPILSKLFWRFRSENSSWWMYWMYFHGMFLYVHGIFTTYCCNKQRFHWHNPWMFAILIMAAVKESCWTKNCIFEDHFKMALFWHISIQEKLSESWINMNLCWIHEYYLHHVFDYIPNVMNQSFQFPQGSLCTELNQIFPLIPSSTPTHGVSEVRSVGHVEVE